MSIAIVIPVQPTTKLVMKGKPMDYRESEAYLQHLVSDHSRIETIAELIIERLELASDNDWEEIDRPILAAQLMALKAKLFGHISEEEAGGVIDEAVARVPSLYAEAKQVFDENDVLKEELGEIAELVANNDRVQATERFKKFTAELKLHDQHETEVAQKGLNLFPFDIDRKV